MRISASILLLLIGLSTKGQENLVINPSFEEYLHCPTGAGEFTYSVANWYSADGSVDYYNECGLNGSGVPVSFLGGGMLIQESLIQVL